MRKPGIRRLLPYWAALLLVLCTAACAPPVPLAAPDLLAPVGVRPDTALVTRGDIASVNLYKGIVRVQSDPLTYGVTDLRFGAFHVVSGQRVYAGDLLATLDTEAVEESVAALQEEMTRQQTLTDYDLRAMELELAVAQTELSALYEAAAGFDADAMMAVEHKKLDIEGLQLGIAQAEERHALTQGAYQADMDALKARLAAAELRAPYDGVITHIAPKVPGDWLAAFESVAFISDEKTRFVEYASLVSLSLPRSARVEGMVDGRSYALTRIELTRQDMAYYLMTRLTPPVRFSIDAPDDGIAPGQYVAIYTYADMAEDTLTVPVNALYADAEAGSYVYQAVNGQRVQRFVEVGRRSATAVEILEGLAEGDEVYVKQ